MADWSPTRLSVWAGRFRLSWKNRFPSMRSVIITVTFFGIVTGDQSIYASSEPKSAEVRLRSLQGHQISPEQSKAKINLKPQKSVGRLKHGSRPSLDQVRTETRSSKQSLLIPSSNHGTGGHEHDGWIEYTKLAAKSQSKAISALVLLAWILYICMMIGSLADVYLTSNLLDIVETLRLSDAVAGVTVVPFANAAGDTILGLLSCFSPSPNYDLYVGDIVGAISFISLVVFGAVILAAGQQGVKLPPWMFVRDLIFVNIAVLLICVQAAAPTFQDLFAAYPSSGGGIHGNYFYLSLIVLYGTYVFCVYIQSGSAKEPDGVYTFHEAKDSRLSGIVHAASAWPNGQKSGLDFDGTDRKSAPQSVNGSVATLADTKPLRGVEPSCLANTEHIPPTIRVWRSEEVSSTIPGLQRRTGQKHSDLEGTGEEFPLTSSLQLLPFFSERSSLRLTRVGKRMMSNSEMLQGFIKRESKRWDKHPGKTHHLGSVHYRLSQTLRRSLSARVDWRATVSEKATAWQRCVRVLTCIFNLIRFLLYDGPDFLWRFTIPTPAYDQKLFTAFPITIAILVTVNFMQSVPWLIRIGICVAAALLSGLFAIFPSTLVAPWEEHHVLRHIRVVAGIFVATLWNIILVTELVNAVKCVGSIIGVSAQTLGLTVIAIGNSLADTFANIAISRSGHPAMGLSSCYGASVYQSLFGIGSVGLLANFVKGDTDGTTFMITPSSFAVLRGLALLLPMLLILSVHKNFHFTKKFAVVTIAAYFTITLYATLGT